LGLLELSMLAGHLGVNTEPIIERNCANERKELRAEIVKAIPKASKEQIKEALRYLRFVKVRLEKVGGWSFMLTGTKQS
jgi:hypothetical protein